MMIARHESDFEFENYKKLAKLAKFSQKIKEKMIITVNDCKEMRVVFAKLNFESVDIKQILTAKNKYKKSQELIIKNF